MDWLAIQMGSRCRSRLSRGFAQMKRRSSFFFLNIPTFSRSDAVPIALTSLPGKNNFNPAQSKSTKQVAAVTSHITGRVSLSLIRSSA